MWLIVTFATSAEADPCDNLDEEQQETANTEYSKKALHAITSVSCYLPCLWLMLCKLLDERVNMTRSQKPQVSAASEIQRIGKRAPDRR